MRIIIGEAGVCRLRFSVRTTQREGCARGGVGLFRPLVIDYTKLNHRRLASLESSKFALFSVQLKREFHCSAALRCAPLVIVNRCTVADSL